MLLLSAKYQVIPLAPFKRGNLHAALPKPNLYCFRKIDAILPPFEGGKGDGFIFTGEIPLKIKSSNNFNF